MNTEKSINEAEGNAVLPLVLPRISHFIDENGNTVDINAGGVIVKCPKCKVPMKPLYDKMACYQCMTHTP